MNPSDLHDLSVNLQKFSDSLDKSNKNVYEQFVLRLKRVEIRSRMFAEYDSPVTRRLIKQQSIFNEVSYWNSLSEEMTALKHAYIEYVEIVEDQLDRYYPNEENQHLDVLESWTEPLDHLSEHAQTLLMTTQHCIEIVGGEEEIEDDEFLRRMCYFDKVLVQVIEIFEMMMAVSDEFVVKAKQYLGIVY